MFLCRKMDPKQGSYKLSFEHVIIDNVSIVTISIWVEQYSFDYLRFLATKQSSFVFYCFIA